MIRSARPTCVSSAGRPRGARARRSSPARRLPKGQRRSLRDLLRTGLDPEKVVAAVEQSLGGTNESARVAAVKFPADLELWRPDEQAAGWPAGASLAAVYAGMSLCELAELGRDEEEEEARAVRVAGRGSGGGLAGSRFARRAS